MAKTRARLVLTSGGLQPVLDAGGRDHSVFARAFIGTLEGNQGILEGHGIFEKVNDRVQQVAASFDLAQIPQYAPVKHAGHESGEFFFVPAN